jgi:hypothetical protein
MNMLNGDGDLIHLDAETEFFLCAIEDVFHGRRVRKVEGVVRVVGLKAANALGVGVFSHDVFLSFGLSRGWLGDHLLEMFGDGFTAVVFQSSNFEDREWIYTHRVSPRGFVSLGIDLTNEGGG